MPSNFTSSTKENLRELINFYTPWFHLNSVNIRSKIWRQILNKIFRQSYNKSSYRLLTWKELKTIYTFTNKKSKKNYLSWISTNIYLVSFLWSLTSTNDRTLIVNAALSTTLTNELFSSLWLTHLNTVTNIHKNIVIGWTH